MIVNYKEDGWLVITQRAHGLLAFQLAMHWKHEQLPERWTEFLLAIAEHDDAEIELDGENLLTPQGGPLNFDMKNFELAHCIKLSEFSVTKSRYVALLTSMHMHFLYRKDAPSNKQAAEFLEDQSKLQTRLRKELKLTKAQAESDYSLLEWCDALSLLLCQDEVQPEKREIEIGEGPGGKKYFLSTLEDDLLTINPWPFNRDSVKVAVEYRILAQLKFGSSAEFRKAFYEAKVQEKSFTFKEDR